MIYKMINPIQHYDWGSEELVPKYFSLPNKNQKIAEIWMGAHPKAPSKIILNNKTLDLNKFIAENTETTIGNRIASNYKKLPFLFKILSAEQPLSIQVHPNLTQAKIGFERENLQNIPLNAFNRSYKDDNHKPELILALTDFYAMCGFRNFSQIKKFFSLIGLYETLKLDEKSPNILRDFYLSLDSLTENDIKKVISKIDALDLNHLSDDEKLAISWVKKIHKIYGYEPTILAPFFLNTIKLTAGKALFLDSGVMHAYLFGLGIEIMANSDNVLRGGLTSKFIDKAELLKVVKFKETHVNIISTKNEENERYSAPIDEFQLFRCIINKKREILSPSVEIVLCVEGNITLNDEITLQKGESAFVEFSQQKYSVSGNGIIFRATTK